MQTTKNKFLTAAALGVLLVSGCSHDRRYAPVVSDVTAPKLPVQQQLLSLAVTEAAAAAADSANFDGYRGRTARVVANGVLPHGQSELLSYVETKFEAALAISGARLLPPRMSAEEVDFGSGEPDAALVSEDVRIEASLDWCGIDVREQKYTMGGKLAGQILTTPVFLFGLIWMAFDPPEAFTYTLSARCKISVYALPVSPGLGITRGEGEGEAQLLVDPRAKVGYTNDFELRGY